MSGFVLADQCDDYVKELKQKIKTAEMQIWTDCKERI